MEEEKRLVPLVAKRKTAHRKQTKITDLKDEHLKEIFKYLSIKDLLHVIQFEPKLKKAARESFTDCHSTDVLIIRNVLDIPSRTVPSLEFLDNFADLVKHLCIDYSKNKDFRRYNHWIESKVAKGCTKSLLSITLINASRVAFSLIGSAFENVQSVCISGNVSTSVMENFNSLFPNVIHLNFDGAKVSSAAAGTYIEQCFPALRHLYIKNGPSNDNVQPFGSQHLLSIISMNPQLMSLNLDDSNADEVCGLFDIAKNGVKITERLLDQISRMLPDLEILDLTLPGDNSDEIKFHFSKLERLIINRHGGELGPVKTFSSRLAILKLSVETLDKHCVKLVLVNGHIGRLKLRFCNVELSKKALETILQEATQIRKLKIITDSSSESLFVPTFFHWLLTKCNHLTKLTLWSALGCDTEKHDDSLRKSAVQTGWARIDFSQTKYFRGISLRKVSS